jgi:ammonia channel protein AmtB
MYTEPAGALAIGTFAGLVSVAGYVYLTPLLQRHIGLLDTCGIHNLHGMPGVIGAVASAIVARVRGGGVGLGGCGLLCAPTRENCERRCCVGAVE